MATLSPFYKALAASSTATSFTAKIPTATEPSGTGVFNVQNGPYGLSSEGPGYAHLLPYGSDANDETFDMRLWGWRKVSNVTLWVPYLICDLSCTLGDIAATGLGTSHFLADTIVLNDGIPAGPFSGLLNNAEELAGGIIVHTLGAQYLDFDFDLTGGAGANCLFALIYA